MRKLVTLFLSACLLLSAAAATAETLPLDLSPAPAAGESGYLSDHEYMDDTLHVWIEDIVQDDSIYHVAHVEIADASQLRTALSCEPGEDGKSVASLIGRAYNAVVGINGDNYLYRSKGYIIRQGVTLRKSTATSLDYLVIDTDGNFHAVRKPTSKTLASVLTAYTVAQCYYFGPVLVMDGEVQTVYNGYGFAPQDRSPRSAIGQVGELSYVLVVVDGRQDESRGVTHKQLAQFMGALGCEVAYNLDGGGSSTLLFHGEVYNTVSGDSERDISDILYFGTGIAGM